MTGLPCGVPAKGTPLFLCLGLLAGGLFCGARAAAGATVDAAAATFTATAPSDQPAALFADAIDYNDEARSVHAQGHVRLWYANITLTADVADADLNEEKIRASGNVSLTEAGKTIQSARLDYDLKTKSAYAQGILLATYPWYYQGKSVEKQGEKNIYIVEPSFTTCNKNHPHYHITADRIDIELGESLTAYNAVFYVGATPMFYLPWIKRSIKDSRPPVSIKVGRNDFEGWFAYIKYNYYFMEQNYGSLLLNLMEKKGLGYGLEHHLRYNWLGKGSDDLSFFYVRDKELERERWTGNVDSRHELSDRDLVQLNWDYLSDNAFNRDFSTSLVDSFQQKSYVAYSRRGDGYYWGLNAQDVNTYDPSPEEPKYFTSLRELPAANFSLSSLKLTSWRYPLYFSLNSSARRYFSRADPAEDVYYRDDFSLTPTFTETYTFPLWVRTQPSISGSLSVPVAGYDYEAKRPATVAAEKDLQTSYTTNLTLTNKWVYYQKTNPTHLLQSRFSHSFKRWLPAGSKLNAPLSGVADNRLGLGLDYLLGTFLTLQATSGYDLLSQLPDWHHRLDNLNLNGRYNWERWNVSGQSVYTWDKQRFTMGTLTAGTSGQDWNTSISAAYTQRESIFTPSYSLYGNLSASYNPGWGLGLQTSLQYDAVKKSIDRITVGVNHDLHCWLLQAAVTQYSDGKMDVGVGINLKAFPQFKAGLGGMSGVSMGEE